MKVTGNPANAGDRELAILNQLKTLNTVMLLILSHVRRATTRKKKPKKR